MFRSLKKFILGGVIIGSVAIFSAVYLFSYFLFTRMVEIRAKETSRAISLQTFATMYQIMSKGWTRSEVESFLAGTKSAYQDSTLRVEIYRAPIVENLFGKIAQSNADDLISQTFVEGEERSVSKGEKTRYLYPLKAREACLRCHVNAGVGNVLGVIEVEQDMTSVISSARMNYILFFILFSPIPFIVALLLAGYFIKRIDRSMLKFREKVNRVNSVSDIRGVDFERIDLGFTELNSVMYNVSELVSKMRRIAIDKDILEFEIKLMEKFIISSEVVKDWKEYLKQLLTEINTVIDTSCVYTIFQIGELEYEMDVFWKARPSDERKKVLETAIRGSMSRHIALHDWNTVAVIHNIADDTEEFEYVDPRRLAGWIDTIVLDSPKIGGIIGIGVQSIVAEDPQKHIVIESILTTLLNAVGAVRAVNKYTRDLEYFATRDPLTNLYNQRVFWDLLEYETGRAERHGYRFALLMIDLDNFKSVNDRYGHSFGDVFLKEFAQVIREQVRKEDIVSRYGGDEFTIILPESDENEAYLIATRIQSALEEISLDGPDGNRVKGTISIGITIYPDHGTSARDLFLVADNMMYRAKKEGKNTLIFPNEEDVAEIFKQIGQKSMLILNAIEEKKVLPYFQPIVDVDSGEVAIHELLMRIDLNGTVCNAADFIDVAENMGVVHKLDYILLEKAFRYTSESNYKGKIFVNLSPRALIIREFISNVKHLAQDYRIQPSDIVFEITERETVRSMSLLEKFVRDLKAEGFKFAVDDFGSGFSSFSYIKRFPIDYVKIDGEFIRNMVLDSRDRAMVKSVTTLARELGIKTVAEFVEGEEIMDAVRSAGIDYAQGYYIGYPSEHLFA